MNPDDEENFVLGNPRDTKYVREKDATAAQTASDIELAYAAAEAAEAAQTASDMELAYAAAEAADDDKEEEDNFNKLLEFLSNNDTSINELTEKNINSVIPDDVFESIKEKYKEKINEELNHKTEESDNPPPPPVSPLRGTTYPGESQPDDSQHSFSEGPPSSPAAQAASPAVAASPVITMTPLGLKQGRRVQAVPLAPWQESHELFPMPGQPEASSSSSSSSSSSAAVALSSSSSGSSSSSSSWTSSRGTSFPLGTQKSSSVDTGSKPRKFLSGSVCSFARPPNASKASTFTTSAATS